MGRRIILLVNQTTCELWDDRLAGQCSNIGRQTLNLEKQIVESTFESCKPPWISFWYLFKNRQILEQRHCPFRPFPSHYGADRWWTLRRGIWAVKHNPFSQGRWHAMLMIQLTSLTNNNSKERKKERKKKTCANFPCHRCYTCRPAVRLVPILRNV